MDVQELTDYRTADLALAAYLVANEIKPHHCEMVDRARRLAVWVFTGSQTVMDLVEVYEDGSADVEPREFVRATGYVRNMLYSFIDAECGR